MLSALLCPLKPLCPFLEKGEKINYNRHELNKVYFVHFNKLYGILELSGSFIAAPVCHG